MRVSFDSTGDFEKAEKWLRDISNRRPDKALDSIGKSGVTNLSNATPVDTGATASGWEYDITSTATGYEVNWTNTAHPGEDVNIAKLIELGYSTGTGGYVPPRPYIKQAMKPIFKSAVDAAAKEMIK